MNQTGMLQAEKEHDKARTNPLVWVSIVVIGLIFFIFIISDRGSVSTETLQLDGQQDEAKPVVEDVVASDASDSSEEQINLESVAAPGQRARDFIGQLRQKGRPYPLEELMAKASTYANEGSLADAHLTFFFAAREGHVEAMMMMAEMSDPALFQSGNNILDQADAVQAYKWYKLALDSGFEPAKPRLDNLYQWAIAESKYGNVDAQQILLNFN